MNNKGVAHIGLILVVVVVGVAVVALALMQSISPSNDYDMERADEMSMEGDTIPSPSPISEDTDYETLEEELNATVVGDFEADINSMEEEASEL